MAQASREGRNIARELIELQSAVERAILVGVQLKGPHGRANGNGSTGASALTRSQVVEEHLDEPWRISGSKETRYVPMQARVGDYALFYRKAAVEITFDEERFLVVPQAAILTLARDE